MVALLHRRSLRKSLAGAAVGRLLWRDALAERPGRGQQEASNKPGRSQQEASKRPGRGQQEARKKPQRGGPHETRKPLKNKHFHEESPPVFANLLKHRFSRELFWGSLKPARSQEARKRPARSQQEARKRLARSQQEASKRPSRTQQASKRPARSQEEST